MRGTQLHEGETKPRQMSANKTLYPLSKRTMRVNAGLENSSGKPTEELINKSSLIMEVKEETATTTNGNNYNPISLKPYNENFIQVELTAAAGDNGQELSIQESNRYLIEDEVIRYYLSYRYRKLKTAATESSEAIWNQWIYVYENMKVLEK